MKKVLFVVLVVALVVAVFAPAVRAGPVTGSEEAILASITINCEALDKVGIIAQSPISPGLSAYGKLYDHAHTFMWPVKGWVRVLVANGIRSTKWPATLVASAPHFNNLESFI